MAAKIITVAIEKGGTGKTVTTSNLAYLMGLDGKRVLCIDTDPQGNLTSALSDGRGEIANGAYDGKALYDMFTGFRFTKTQDFITATEYGDSVDMIPGSSQTPRINQRLPELFEDATFLSKSDSSKRINSIADFLFYFLKQVVDEYDYIIIDTQPTRDSLLLTNAISAADYVLIPTMCDANSQESAFRTFALCNELSNAPGSRLKGVGVLLTAVMKKAAATKLIRAQCQEVLGPALFKYEIPHSLSVGMAVTNHQPVCFTAPKQPVSIAYKQVYRELKERLAKLEVK
jgi:chromosome partitioning protein